MLEQKTIAVVVPAFCEEERILPTLAGIPPWIDRIFVVDDRSTDETATRVLGHPDARVELLRHETNRGVGGSIATGSARAFDEGADVVVVMAGDNQMDPRDLPAVVRPIVEGAADYVKGNRFAHPEVHRMPLLRRAGSSFLGWVTSRIAGLSLTDSQCGYTALGRAAGLAFPWAELWPRYGYPNDVLIWLGKNGYRVAEVPVRPIYAGEKSGLRPWHVLTILGVISRRARLERDRPARQRVTLDVPRAVHAPLLPEEPADLS